MTFFVCQMKRSYVSAEGTVRVCRTQHVLVWYAGPRYASISEDEKRKYVASRRVAITRLVSRSRYRALVYA